MENNFMCVPQWFGFDLVIKVYVFYDDLILLMIDLIISLKHKQGAFKDEKQIWYR